MRIALVADPFVPVPPEKYGGIEQVLYYLIRGLKEAGHEPILFGPGDSTIDCEVVPITPTALYFPRTKQGLKEHAKAVKKAQVTTRRKLKELAGTYDIIHSHAINHMYPFDMTPYKNVPSVTTLHNKIDFGNIDYFMKRRDLNYVSISSNQQAVCPELNYIGVVYNGENPDEFPVVTKPEDYVCFLGRFDRDKSPHLAIQLALNLGIKIKLAGKIDFDGEGYFEEEVEKHFDNPLVDYLGELDFKDKVELLSHAKCNLHPTNFREPFGLTVLEAAYCGTPTLAVARGSMPELIEPGRTGLLVEDMLEGRYQIEDCYDMDRNYIALRARQLFNYKTMAEEYVEIYKQVIDSTKTANGQQGLIGRLWQAFKGPLPVKPLKRK